MLALFSQPGQRLVALQVDGPFVSAEGIDWENCAPGDSEYCILARFFESLSPPMENIGDAEHRTIQGGSNLFIHTGSAPSHPMEGFLIWPLRLEQTLNLCPVTAPTVHHHWKGAVDAE